MAIRAIVVAFAVFCGVCGVSVLNVSATPTPEPDGTPTYSMWEEIAVYSQTPGAPVESQGSSAAFNGETEEYLDSNASLGVSDDGGEAVSEGSYSSVDCNRSGIPITYHFFDGGEAQSSSIMSDSMQSNFGVKGDATKCAAACRKEYRKDFLCKCLDYCIIASKDSNGCDTLEQACSHASGIDRTICRVAYEGAC